MKIKINELRIGNLVREDYSGNMVITDIFSSHEPKQLNLRHPNHTAIGRYDLKNIKPIPLTEEWLLKFGFEKALNGMFCPREYLWLKQHKLNNEWFAGVNCIGDIDCTRIDYVHQLQNLYFSLTGTELEIKY